MIETTDGIGAAAPPGTSGARMPFRDPELQAQVWAILDAAVGRGEEPPSARAIRPMVRRNNSDVLRLVAAWHQERRVQVQMPGVTPAAPLPPTSVHEPLEGAFMGMPQAVAAMLRTANEALAAAAHALVQVAPAFRDALTEADRHAERRLGDALAATSMATEAALTAERERFAAERALLQDAADARMAEAARITGDAADMMEELEARESDTLDRMTALESRIATAGVEATAQQRRIDELQRELADTRHERDQARLEVAALTGRIEISNRMHAELETRFNGRETDRRQEVDRLRSENDRQRDDLTEAHRQIAALVAQQAGAAGSLGALAERLLAAMPAASEKPDAPRDGDGPADSCATERNGGVAAPARPKSRPARRRDAARGKQETRLPFGPDFGVVAPRAADAAGTVANAAGPPVAADSAVAPADP